MAEDGVVPVSEGSAAASGATKAVSVANLDYVAANRSNVLVSKPVPNAMQCAKMHAYDYWQITNVEQGERWSNQIMGYSSNRDANSNLKIKFDTREEALAYCEKMGWAAEVEEPTHEARSFHGEKNYNHNFLSQQAEHFINKNVPSYTSRSLYKYSKGRAPDFVNMVRSKYEHEHDWTENVKVGDK